MATLSQTVRVCFHLQEHYSRWTPEDVAMLQAEVAKIRIKKPTGNMPVGSWAVIAENMGRATKSVTTEYYKLFPKHKRE